MKRLLLIAFLFSLTTAVHAQTESETIDWLNAKVPSLCSDIYGKHLKFRSGSWELLYGYFTGTDKKSQVYEVNPRDIGNISTKKFNGGTTITVTSKNKSILLVDYDYYSGAKLAGGKYVNTATLDLQTTDDTQVNKVVKALKYLATLNGAKLVNDDLF